MRFKGGYGWRRSLIPFLLMFYFLSAIYAPRSGFSEFYPFFNWSLFSNYSDFNADVVVYVNEVNGAPLDDPKLYFDMVDIFGHPVTGAAHVTKLLDDIYIHLVSKHDERAQNLIEKFESSYLRV